jgi:hypothetical protein
MKTLISLVAVFSLASCSNVFNVEDLTDLKEEAVVIWTVDGSHYHFQQWTFDDQGNVSGVGTKCSSKSTKVDHPYENATDFSGTIEKSSITTVKTSSANSVGVLVIVLVVFIAGGVASYFQHWWG